MDYDERAQRDDCADYPWDDEEDYDYDEDEDETDEEEDYPPYPDYGSPW